MIKLVAGLVLCLGLVAGMSHKLPDNFLRCHKKDPELNACLKKAIQNVIPSIVKGIPSLGVFPLDPLMVTELDIGDSNGGAVVINLKFRELLMKNFHSLKINEVKADLKNYKLVILAEMTKPLVMEGKFEADGKVLILPVKSKGDCILKLENLTATLTLTGKQKKKNSVGYMDVKDVTLDFETTRLHLDFKNKLGSTAIPDEVMNRVLNENWKEVLQDVKPGIEAGLGATFKEISNRVFSKVPYDQIFL